MGFFGNLKDKAIDKFFVRDEEYDKEEETNEVGYAAENAEEPESADGITPPPYNNSYSYSPTGGLDAPEYEFSSNNSSNQASEFRFAKATAFSSASSPASAPAPEFKFSGDKKSANIYSMNSVRPLSKFKLNCITLKDIYGSKDVALLMMEKDTIILVDFSLLDEEQKLRAMDFIDGAKCVTNAIFGRLNEDIIVFVPENVELRGDFQSQVDFDSIL